jgi:serine/threonine-protein kinase RCK2
MAAIQNFKNFLRHGKQARNAHAEPTTNVSNVHAQQQRHHQDRHYAHSDPNILDHKPLQANAGGPADFSAAAIDNRNIAAQAGHAAAQNAGDKHKQHAHNIAGTTDRKGKEIDPTVLERIVAEEREAKGKLPNYPGLERWTLLEKMGDGAFSNVYRAKDNTGQYGEAAIKVVRKFEMNSSQGDEHMHPDFKKAPKTVERANILKEVQIMRQLDHPNIVKLIDFSESPVLLYHP